MNKLRMLVSVADKEGIVEFCRAVEPMVGEYIASGGTGAVLRGAGLPVTSIEDLGAHAEMLDGRVKTLQPQIHGGILARRDAAHLEELEANNMRAIDVVVVNLYPFEETVARGHVTPEEAIEQIDIGGVALLRAAAKNHEHVTVVTNPADYARVAAGILAGGVDASLRRSLAVGAFRRTTAYDRAIAGWLAEDGPGADTGLPQTMDLHLELLQECRYGENPHQAGGYYGSPGTDLPFVQLHGKAMSFNNWQDLDAAWQCASAFSQPAMAVIKHGNPCGLATAQSLETAWEQALASDPISAFGSVVAANRAMDLATADRIGSMFVDVVVAPDWEPDALKRLQRKRNVRLLQARKGLQSDWQVSSAVGGYLVQERDRSADDLIPANWECATVQQPTEAQLVSLGFAWHVARFVKSNAIVLAAGTATVGIGAGQMSRLDSVWLACRKAGDRSRGSVLASDAYFPFPDGLEAAAAAGVTAVVQPGGSLRDNQVVKAADDLGLVMMMTGRRHFLH